MHKSTALSRAAGARTHAGLLYFNPSSAVCHIFIHCIHRCLFTVAGVMTRSRSVLQQAHEEGRPCASQLSQTKPCPISPCYTWLLSDWSPCTVEVDAFCSYNLRAFNPCFVWPSGIETSHPACLSEPGTTLDLKWILYWIEFVCERGTLCHWDVR